MKNNNGSAPLGLQKTASVADAAKNRADASTADDETVG
jgi:hypothetical protein